LRGPTRVPVACREIEHENGVCRSAVERDTAAVAPDVTRFPGHIACDSRSQSEITLPVRNKSGACRAVLDVDSADRDPFDEIEEEFLRCIVTLIYK